MTETKKNLSIKKVLLKSENRKRTKLLYTHVKYDLEYGLGFEAHKCTMHCDIYAIHACFSSQPNNVISGELNFIAACGLTSLDVSFFFS